LVKRGGFFFVVALDQGSKERFRIFRATEGEEIKKICGFQIVSEKVKKVLRRLWD
jgi:hypothetical protein